MNEWIDKKKRLPTKADADAEQCVLVWHKCNGCMVYRISAIAESSSITHWMSLPPSPEKENR